MDSKGFLTRQVEKLKQNRLLFCNFVSQIQNMVITIHFQSEQDLQWLSKIVEMLKKAAVRFEVQGFPPEKAPGVRQRRQAFLKAVNSGRVITTPITIPNREERNAR